MSTITYIVTVPSERLSGLSRKTFYDAAGKRITLEEATQKAFLDTQKNDEDKDCDNKGAKEEGNHKALDAKEHHDLPNNDDEVEEEVIEDDVSYRDGIDEFEEFEWMEAIYGEATIPDDTSDTKAKRIANCVAKIIDRGEIRGSFEADMDLPSRDTSTVASELFDRYGRLKRELREHPVKKGSGIWGKELDTGDFLLIELLTVEKDHQRQGIATKLANIVQEYAQEKCRSIPFSFVWATHYHTTEYSIEVATLSSKERKASFNRSQARAVAFWRSLGYRRVGSTQFLCLAADSNHPSRKLAAKDDYDPPVRNDTVEDGRDFKDAYPVHYCIAHSSDADVVSFLEQRLLAFPVIDTSWRIVDHEGRTIVHVASECTKPHTLRWILERPFGTELVSFRTYAGETPLESLEIALEAKRINRDIEMIDSRWVLVSDCFSGFEAESVSCVILLKGSSSLSRLDVARFMFGYVARVAGPVRCEWKDHYFQHMLPHVSANLATNKSLRQGFTNMFDRIASCLRLKQAPTTENVLGALDAASEWPPCTRNFLQRGGSVASAVLQVLEFAMDQDEMIGDGEHQATFEEDIDELKECRNDTEWAFVRRLCGFADERKNFGMGVELGMETGGGGHQLLGKRTREEQTGDDVYGTSKRVA